MLLVALLLLTLLVAALVDIAQRPRDDVRHLPKAVWIIIVVLLPLIGSILWFTVGRAQAPKGARRERRTARSKRAPADDPRPDAAPTSTETQLAALEREIEEAERDERIRQLEAEVRRRRDAGETA